MKVIFFISVDIDNCHDKCQSLFISSLKLELCSKVKVVETRPSIFLNKINIELEKIFFSFCMI